MQPSSSNCCVSADATTWHKLPRQICIAAWLGLALSVPPALGQGLRLDVNDVSYLWPPVTNAADAADLLSADELTADGVTPIWPKQHFAAAIATAQTIKVVNSEGKDDAIDFGAANRAAFSDPHNWKVVAVRIDPSAPGCSAGVIAQFGSIPQIRLILQPVIVNAGSVKVHDLTAHLGFSFILPPVAPAGPVPAIPDKAAFGEIVKELAVMKAKLAAAGKATAGPLGVHPALKDKATGFAGDFKAFLKRHLSEPRLNLIAFMGLASVQKPWVFFTMRKGPAGVFVPVPLKVLGGQNAQMLTFGIDGHVMPVPAPTNLGGTKGVSTAVLFEDGIDKKLATPVFAGDPRPLHQDIPDIIANPEIANVFNTDCVSCHTESARRIVLKIPAGDGQFRFPLPAGLSGVDPAVLPKHRWNVRNFGWFPFGKKVSATVTQRTANESAETADFINREYLK